jgi:hypothetical protein
VSAPPKKWPASLAIGAAIGVSVWLLIVFLPYALTPAGEILIGGRDYTYESQSLFNNGSWQNYTYRGVTFEFHLWCFISSGGAELCGNATESPGVSFPYSFSDGPTQINPQWQTWIAPDGHEGVQYKQGGSARLLVAA